MVNPFVLFPAGGIPEPYIYYTMDNIVGSTLVDEKGNSNGTITGATTTSGVIGNALSFDGVDDFVDTGYLARDTFGGVSLWVTRSQSARTTFHSISDPTANTTAFLFQWETDGSIRIVFARTGQAADICTSNDTVSVDANIFHHVVIKSTGSAWEVYLNNVNQTLSFSSGSNVGRWFDEMTGTQNILLSRALFFGNDIYYPAKIDQYRYYAETDLSEDDVSALYNEV